MMTPRPWRFATREIVRSVPQCGYGLAPVARYVLGEMTWEDVLAAATGHRDLASATQRANDDLLSRRQLCASLFYDGVKRRAQGAEDQCLQRMEQCVALKDPLIEFEWYLARYEVEQAHRGA
jgi:hypothetical protein